MLGCGENARVDEGARGELGACLLADVLEREVLQEDGRGVWIQPEVEGFARGTDDCREDAITGRGEVL